jgi:hypothetical protein
MRTPSLTDHGAILLAGFVLAAVGIAYAPAAPPQGGQTTTTTPPPLPMVPAMGNANSNNSMIAVTGIDLTGSSVLYLIDTVNHQMAVYQAMGGSDATQSVKLIGARRIDLDLQLYGFNDKSQYRYEELQQKFADNKRTVQPPVK